MIQRVYDNMAKTFRTTMHAGPHEIKENAFLVKGLMKGKKFQNNAHFVRPFYKTIVLQA